MKVDEFQLVKEQAERLDVDPAKEAQLAKGMLYSTGYLVTQDAVAVEPAAAI